MLGRCRVDGVWGKELVELNRGLKGVGREEILPGEVGDSTEMDN